MSDSNQDFRIEWHSGTLVVIPGGDIESMKWDLIEQAAEIDDSELAVDARFECRNVADDGVICRHRWHLRAWVVRRLVYY